MLSAAKKIMAHHRQAADLGLTTLIQTPLSSLLTLWVISIALLFPALLWLLTHNLKMVTQGMEEQGRFSVYLAQKASHELQGQVLKTIKTNPKVKQATLITPDQGLAFLKAQEGMQDITAYLGHNPLPPMIEVTPVLFDKNPKDIEKLSRELKHLKGVESVKMDKQWIARFNAMMIFLGQIADGLFILLGAAVMLIIGNTLRMLIEHRREEIEVLKLVGASHAYIMRPFLYVGAIYAGLGAVFAILLLQAIVMGVTLLLNQVATLYDMHIPMIGFGLSQSFIFILGALILGGVGARLSVQSQLAFIEP